MVCTVCHQKEQSNYGLHCVSSEGAVYGLHCVSSEGAVLLWSTLCVIRRSSLIMVYTVCHQKEHSNYSLHCVSSEGSVYGLL